MDTHSHTDTQSHWSHCHTLATAGVDNDVTYFVNC